MKRFGLIFFLLSLLLVLLTPSALASLDLFFGEIPVELDVPLMVVNGNILLPISVLDDYLGASIHWSHGQKEARVQFSGIDISMQVGKETVLVNGKEKVLDVAPEFSDGFLMLPMRFIADELGLRINFDAENMAIRLMVPQDVQNSLGIDLTRAPLSPDSKPAEPVIEQEEYRRQLQDIVYLGGPRSKVFVDVYDYTGYQSVLLINPNRLVLDLYGVSSEPFPDKSVDGPLVRQVRSSRFDSNTLRIVFDLNEATGYEIATGAEGGLEIEFNYQVTDFGFEREGSTAKVWFYASERPPLNVIHLSNPLRLVLDLEYASLMGSAQEYAVEDSVVRRIRASQFSPSVTRMVLELDAPITPVSMEKVGDRYEIRLFDGTPQALAEVQQFESEIADLEEQIEITEEDRVLLSHTEIPDNILEGHVIAIDPGHGGTDPGAIGPHGTFEKDVVLEVSLLLGALLEEAGAKVVFTRNTDSYVSIFERPQIAERHGAEVLVSIHVNAYLEQVARGTETLYQPRSNQNRMLAQALQIELVNSLQLIDRGLRQRSDLAVLNGAKMPTALVEIGFVNHPEEELLLRSPGFQDVAAEGLYNGIVRYFLENRGE